MGLEHADRLAGLHQQGLVVVQVGQAFDDLVVALPVTCRTTDTTVNHQFFRVLGDFRVAVVHQHAQRRFGQPALGGQLVTAGSADFNVTKFSHEKNSSAINPKPTQAVGEQANGHQCTPANQWTMVESS
ncbi:hypothetical protein D9M73_206720 [compost metagenome]